MAAETLYDPLHMRIETHHIHTEGETAMRNGKAARGKKGRRLAVLLDSFQRPQAAGFPRRQLNGSRNQAAAHALAPLARNHMQP